MEVCGHAGNCGVYNRPLGSFFCLQAEGSSRARYARSAELRLWSSLEDPANCPHLPIPAAIVQADPRLRQPPLSRSFVEEQIAFEETVVVVVMVVGAVDLVAVCHNYAATILLVTPRLSIYKEVQIHGEISRNHRHEQLCDYAVACGTKKAELVLMSLMKEVQAALHSLFMLHSRLLLMPV